MNPLSHYRTLLFRRLLRNQKIARFMSRHCLKAYLAMFYENWTGKRMNYADPQDLNQALIKLSWQNSLNPKMRELIPLCVDKYAVREYIASKGYADTLNVLYGVYDNVDDIDFDALPNQFVMKMTNASGRNYICADKSECNWSKIKKQFALWLKDTNFGWQTGEWQYGLIQPRIVVEKYLSSIGEIAPIDYKFQCFHGEPNSCFVGYNRDPRDTHGIVCFDDYDMDWNLTERILPWWHKSRKLIPRPQNLERMIQMAKDCTKDFPYCRFDLYEVEGKILFGEMTFTPQGNVQEFYSGQYLKEAKNLL